MTSFTEWNKGIVNLEKSKHPGGLVEQLISN